MSSPARKARLSLFAVAAAIAIFACSSSSGEAGPSPDGATHDGGTGLSSDGSTTGADGSMEEPPGPPAIQLIGRFDERDTAGPKCSWPGCRIVARFEGTAVSAELDEHVAEWMEGAPSEWDVLIDGVLQPKLVTEPGSPKTYVLATDLPPGKHQVELYKRSEAQNGTTQFRGFDFRGGTLLAPPLRASRRIEIIGDSSAAAFGVEGDGHGPSCPGYNWAAKWQNFRKSFGALLGERVGAEVVGTVYSGKGMAKNIWHPDTETMPIIYGRSNPIDGESSWDFSRYVPDVVIIMIGGNDFAIGQPEDQGPATLQQFTDAYDGFVANLRTKYPDAHMFLVTSPSVSDAEPPGRNTRTNVKSGIATVIERRAAASDTKVYSVEPAVAQPSELTGCDGHGNPAFHSRVADNLLPLVRAKTGW